MRYILMDESITKDIVSTISLEEATKLRKKLSEKIQYIRKQKSLRMEVYIQAEYRDAVESAKDWAFEKELIKRNTKWTFAKFCIINTTKMILAQMEKEKDEKLRQQANVNSQRQAQPAYDPNTQDRPPQHHTR